MDDGSTDDTQEALKAYAMDSRFRCILFPENRGMGAALIAAPERAGSSIIAYLPSDDIIYPDHLECPLRCLETNPQAMLVYAGWFGTVHPELS